MKIDEFKKILKPLIEQTVKEVLLQQGVLSQVVQEVAQGLGRPVLESAPVRTQSRIDESREEKKELEEKYEEQRQARIKRLNESTGLPAGVFDNVKQIRETSSTSPLSSTSPGDAGVDISGIQKLSNGKWKTLVGRK